MNVELHPSWKYRLAVAFVLGLLILAFKSPAFAIVLGIVAFVGIVYMIIQFLFICWMVNAFLQAIEKIRIPGH